MSTKKKGQHDDGFENIEQALSKTEQYIEENKKSLSIIVAAILIVVGGYISYKRFYVEPRETQAQSEIFMAERYFEQDSFLLALEGDGMNYGFLEIIDEFGVTNTANLSYYYAGICYLHMGDFEEAIDHLKQFDSNDRLVSVIALGAIGDAYVELEEYENGVSYYEKAAAENENEYTSALYLKKAGMVYEELGEYQKAVTAYEKIKTKYPNATEARNIDRYISAAKMKL